MVALAAVMEVAILVAFLVAFLCAGLRLSLVMPRLNSHPHQHLRPGLIA
jgi:hypothetical protein